MGVLLQNFPKIIDKKEINYEEFIFILGKKANLNRVYKTEIKGEGVEYFDKETQNNIMELDSVKGLYNSI